LDTKNKENITDKQLKTFARGTIIGGTTTGISLGALLSQKEVREGTPSKFIVDKKFNIKPTSQSHDFANYIQKNKGLATSFEEAEMPLKSYFHPFKNKVVAGGHLGITAHEFGHAQNLKAYEKILGNKGGKAFGQLIYSTLPGNVKMPLLGLAAIPFTHPKVTDTIKKVMPRTGEKLEKHPEAIVAAASIPKLYEEGSASVRAIKDIRAFVPGATKTLETQKAIKALVPAFGTYVAASIPAIVAAKLWSQARKEKLINGKKSK
jgi:hypothetical protein